MLTREKLDPLFTPYIFVKPEPKEQAFTFSVKTPTSKETTLEFLKNNKEQFKKDIERLINDLKNWLKEKKIDSPEQDDHFSKFLGKFATESENYFPLFSEGVQALEKIVHLIRSKKTNPDIAKLVIKNLIPGLSVCAPGTHTNLVDAYLKLEVDLNIKLAGIRSDLLKQATLQIIRLNIKNGALQETGEAMETHYVSPIVKHFSSLLGIEAAVTNDNFSVNLNQVLNIVNELNYKIPDIINANTIINQLLTELESSEIMEYMDNVMKKEGKITAKEMQEKALPLFNNFVSHLNIYSEDPLFLNVFFDEIYLDDQEEPVYQLTDYAKNPERERFLMNTLFVRLQNAGFFKKDSLQSKEYTATKPTFSTHINPTITLNFSYVLEGDYSIKTRIPLLTYFVSQIKEGKTAIWQEISTHPYRNEAANALLSSLNFNKIEEVEKLLSNTTTKEILYEADSDRLLNFMLLLPPNKRNFVTPEKMAQLKLKISEPQDFANYLFLFLKEEWENESQIKVNEPSDILNTLKDTAQFSVLLAKLLNNDKANPDLLNTLKIFVSKLNGYELGELFSNFTTDEFSQIINKLNHEFAKSLWDNDIKRFHFLSTLSPNNLLALLHNSNITISTIIKKSSDLTIIMKKITPENHEHLLRTIDKKNLASFIRSSDELACLLDEANFNQRFIFIEMLENDSLKKIITNANQFALILSLLSNDDRMKLFTKLGMASVLQLTEKPHDLAKILANLDEASQKALISENIARLKTTLSTPKELVLLLRAMDIRTQIFFLESLPPNFIKQFVIKTESLSTILPHLPLPHAIELLNSLDKNELKNLIKNSNDLNSIIHKLPSKNKIAFLKQLNPTHIKKMINDFNQLSSFLEAIDTRNMKYSEYSDYISRELLLSNNEGLLRFLAILERTDSLKFIMSLNSDELKKFSPSWESLLEGLKIIMGHDMQPTDLFIHYDDAHLRHLINDGDPIDNLSRLLLMTSPYVYNEILQKLGQTSLHAIFQKPAQLIEFLSQTNDSISTSLLNTIDPNVLLNTIKTPEELVEVLNIAEKNSHHGLLNHFSPAWQQGFLNEKIKSVDGLTKFLNSGYDVYDKFQHLLDKKKMSALFKTSDDVTSFLAKLRYDVKEKFITTILGIETLNQLIRSPRDLAKLSLNVSSDFLIKHLKYEIDTTPKLIEFLSTFDANANPTQAFLRDKLTNQIINKQNEFRLTKKAEFDTIVNSLSKPIQTTFINKVPLSDLKLITTKSQDLATLLPMLREQSQDLLTDIPYLKNLIHGDLNQLHILIEALPKESKEPFLRSFIHPIDKKEMKVLLTKFKTSGDFKAHPELLKLYKELKKINNKEHPSLLRSFFSKIRVGKKKTVDEQIPPPSFYHKK